MTDRAKRRRMERRLEEQTLANQARRDHIVATRMWRSIEYELSQKQAEIDSLHDAIEVLNDKLSGRKDGGITPA